VSRSDGFNQAKGDQKTMNTRKMSARKLASLKVKTSVRGGARAEEAKK
jgi:hypothetical protein